MSAANRRIRPSQLLARNEWDFEPPTLPERELRACHAHEYDREAAKQSHRLVDLLHDYWEGARAPKEHTSHRRASQCIRELSKLSVSVTLLQPNSNGIDWRSLSRDVRENAISICAKRTQWSNDSRSSLCLLISTIRELEPSGCVTMRSFQFVDELCRRHKRSNKSAAQVEYGFFAIDWSCRDRLLKEQFSLWLAQQRAELAKRGAKRPFEPSRGGARDQLRYLGALRIIRHYGRKRLVDQNFKPLKVDAPYANLPDLYDAANLAREIIEHRVQEISKMDVSGRR